MSEREDLEAWEQMFYGGGDSEPAKTEDAAQVADEPKPAASAEEEPVREPVPAPADVPSAEDVKAEKAPAPKAEEKKAEPEKAASKDEKQASENKPDMKDMGDEELDQYLNSLSDKQLKDLNQEANEKPKKAKKAKSKPKTDETAEEKAPAGDMTTKTAYGWLLLYTAVPIVGWIIALINAFAAHKRSVRYMSRGWLFALLTVAGIIAAMIVLSNYFHVYFLTDLLNALTGNGRVVVEM